MLKLSKYFFFLDFGLNRAGYSIPYHLILFRYHKNQHEFSER